MFHKGGQFATMHPAYLGLTTVILPSPEPNAILEAIERHRPTFAVLVPSDHEDGHRLPMRAAP